MRLHFAAPARHGIHVVLMAGLTSVLALGCVAAATPVPTTTPPSPTPVASPTAAASPVGASPTAAASPVSSARPITLRAAPNNLGCDAIGVDYARMTFRIDPNAVEQVVAVTDTNVQLQTSWSAGFRQAPTGERAIVDPSGRVVATDGQVLQKAASSATRLAGYFVCLAPTQIYVLLRDPS